MERFTRLFTDLEEASRPSEKLEALERYFREAPARDAAWALYFLTGHKPPRAVATPLLRQWVAEETGYPPWLLETCYEAVGDLAETLALLLPEHEREAGAPALHCLIEERLLPLKALDANEQREVLRRTWGELDRPERLVWHKLLTGSLRLGAARPLVIRALALAAEIEPAELAHRLQGPWQPTERDYLTLLGGDPRLANPGRPYPFLLASALEGTPAELGPLEPWQAEWTWDGLRAQLIRRHGQVLVWSRGEELVTDRFPEVAALGAALPDGTVLDGEIVAWQAGGGEGSGTGSCGARPFGCLQRRLGRARPSAAVLAEFSVVYMAFDLLEREGEDLRGESLAERRRQLEALAAELRTRLDGQVESATHLRLSPLLEAGSWAELERRQSEARAGQARGLMLKRRDSAYGAGRVRGDWWKWQAEPFTVEAVLLYAQQGHSPGVGLSGEYTLGLWQNGLLVPIARAGSCLSDEDHRALDAFIRANTLERHGPVRAVRPELVFELAFEGIQASPRHKAGLTLRAPRMTRWLRDKPPGEVDTVEDLRARLPEHG